MHSHIKLFVKLFVDKPLLALNYAKPVALSGFLGDFAPDGDGVFKGQAEKLTLNLSITAW
jgi:hypothetical protein